MTCEIELLEIELFDHLTVGKQIYDDWRKKYGWTVNKS